MRPMSPVLLIFDLDGTLIDSRRDLAAAVNLMRGHFHLDPLPVDIVSGYVGDGVRALVKRATRESPGIDLDEALRIQRQFYREHLHDETVLYPGVREGLEALHARGHQLVVATNKPAEFSEIVLKHFGIRHLFAHVAGDGNVERLKPDPAMITAAMRSLGFDAARTWVIGDNHTDLEAARRAGARSVFVTYGIGTTGKEKPDVTCATFAEMVALFS